MPRTPPSTSACIVRTTDKDVTASERFVCRCLRQCGGPSVRTKPRIGPQNWPLLRPRARRSPSLLRTDAVEQVDNQCVDIKRPNTAPPEKGPTELDLNSPTGANCPQTNHALVRLDNHLRGALLRVSAISSGRLHMTSQRDATLKRITLRLLSRPPQKREHASLSDLQLAVPANASPVLDLPSTHREPSPKSSECPPNRPPKVLGRSWMERSQSNDDSSTNIGLTRRDVPTRRTRPIWDHHMWIVLLLQHWGWARHYCGNVSIALRSGYPAANAPNRIIDLKSKASRSVSYVHAIAKTLMQATTERQVSSRRQF